MTPSPDSGGGATVVGEAVVVLVVLAVVLVVLVLVVVVVAVVVAGGGPQRWAVATARPLAQQPQIIPQRRQHRQQQQQLLLLLLLLLLLCARSTHTEGSNAFFFHKQANDPKNKAPHQRKASHKYRPQTGEGELHPRTTKSPPSATRIELSGSTASSASHSASGFTSGTPSIGDA
jgi:hypothetical protein